jgi:hypothetical protein
VTRAIARPLRVFAVLAVLGTAVAILPAQAPAPAPSPLPLGPARERGTSITPAFEGWYENGDGTFSLLAGYFNRNSREALDIPVGPNNRLEPGEADQGQPTHFQVGRQWGVLVITVPKDFGTKVITWTIVSNGESQSIPLSLKKGYSVTPFQESGMGNRPPILAFSQNGPTFTGPPSKVAATLSGTAKQPTVIDVWVEDPKEPSEGSGGRSARLGTSVATVSFHKFRGPGTIVFEPARAPVPTQGAKVSTKATFSAPGEYVVRVQGNDESGEGGGGFQCCWTNTYVKVSVK